MTSEKDGYKDVYFRVKFNTVISLAIRLLLLYVLWFQKSRNDMWLKAILTGIYSRVTKNIRK